MSAPEIKQSCNECRRRRSGSTGRRTDPSRDRTTEPPEPPAAYRTAGLIFVSGGLLGRPRSPRTNRPTRRSCQVCVSQPCDLVPSPKSLSTPGHLIRQWRFPTEAFFVNCWFQDCRRPPRPIGDNNRQLRTVRSATSLTGRRCSRDARTVSRGTGAAGQRHMIETVGRAAETRSTFAALADPDGRAALGACAGGAAVRAVAAKL